MHCLLVVGGAAGTVGEGADSLGTYNTQCTCVLCTVYIHMYCTYSNICVCCVLPIVSMWLP